MEQAKPRESSARNDRWNGERDTSTLEDQRVILGKGEVKVSTRAELNAKFFDFVRRGTNVLEDASIIHSQNTTSPKNSLPQLSQESSLI